MPAAPHHQPAWEAGSHAPVQSLAALRGCFAPGRKPVPGAFRQRRDPEFWMERLREAWKLAERIDRPGLLAFDLALHEELSPDERELSLSRADDLAETLTGAWHLGVAGWLIRERNAGAMAGHFLTLFTARAVEFQLSPLPVAMGWLQWLAVEERFSGEFGDGGGVELP